MFQHFPVKQSNRKPFEGENCWNFKKTRVNVIETTGIKGGNGRKDVGYHWCVTCNCSAGKSSFFLFFFFRAASGSRCGRLGDSQTSRSISRTRSVIDGATSVQLWPRSSGHWRRRCFVAAYGALDKNSQISGILVVFPNLTRNSIKIHSIIRPKNEKSAKNRVITWNFEQVTETCALFALNVWPYFINVCYYHSLFAVKVGKKKRNKKKVWIFP